MSVSLSFTNPPAAVPPIDCAAVVRDFVAKYPGFPAAWYWHPGAAGSDGAAGRFPIDLAASQWRPAVSVASGAGVELVPYLAAGADQAGIPTGVKLDGWLRRLKPSKWLAFDQVSDDEAGSASNRLYDAALANGFGFIAEANAIRDWIKPGPKVRICTEWWKCSLAISGAVMSYNDRCWSIEAQIDAGSKPAVLIARDNNSKGFGFKGLTLAQWGRKKVDIASQYHDKYGDAVELVVRPAGIDEHGIKTLREMNG